MSTEVKKEVKEVYPELAIILNSGDIAKYEKEFKVIVDSILSQTPNTKLETEKSLRKALLGKYSNAVEMYQTETNKALQESLKQSRKK